MTILSQTWTWQQAYDQCVAPLKVNDRLKGRFSPFRHCFCVVVVSIWNTLLFSVLLEMEEKWFEQVAPLLEELEGAFVFSFAQQDVS